MASKPIPDTGDNPVTWTLYRVAYPIARVCHRLGMSANFVSGLSLFTALWGVVALVGFRSQSWFVLLWIISIVMDFADGTVARMSERVNQTALRLDHTLDLLKISAGFVGLAAYWNTARLWTLCMLSLAALLIFTVLNHDLGRVTVANKSSSTDPRPLGARFLRALIVPVLTLHAGSLLLLGFAAIRLGWAFAIFAYIFLLCAALAFRCARLLGKYPKPPNLVDHG